MLGVMLAAGAGAVAVALAWRESLRVSRLAPPDPASFERTMQSGEPRAAAAALHAAFPEAAPALMSAAAARGSSRAGAVALNEHLSELHRELSSSQSVATGAVRVALLSGALGGVLALLGDPASETAWPRRSQPASSVRPGASRWAGELRGGPRRYGRNGIV